MPQQTPSFCVLILIILLFFLANFVASDHTISHLHMPSPSPSHVPIPPSTPAFATGPSPVSPKKRATAPSPSPQAPEHQTHVIKETYDEDQSPAPSPAPFSDQADDFDYESFPFVAFAPGLGYSPALAPWMGGDDLFLSPADSPSDFSDYAAADIGAEEERSSGRSIVKGALWGALLAVGLVGLGGFVYYKMKNSASDVVTRGHYQSVGRNVV